MGKPRRQNQMSKVKIRPPNLLFKLKELIPQLTAEESGEAQSDPYCTQRPTGQAPSDARLSAPASHLPTPRARG